MNDNCFVDTNIFVYFRDASEPEKQAVSETWLRYLWQNQSGRLSFQVLNEYYLTVTGKLKPGLDKETARQDIKNLMLWNPVIVESQVVENGWRIQDHYRFSWWDSLIVSAAQKANCSYLLTEDLQHEQAIDNLIIINPFITDFESFIEKE